jgi:hypothetical protein
MIDDFERAARDWPDEWVHVERFVPPALPVDPNARPYTLAPSRSKLEMRVEPGQTMLAALLSLGIDIPIEGAPLHRDRVSNQSSKASLTRRESAMPSSACFRRLS